jgi:AraC-like DNA-binding protein
MIHPAEEFLRTRLPATDDTVTLVNQIVDRIAAAPSMTRIDELAQQFHLSQRSLERLFQQYVGISPKWVIKQYRLHEAAEQVAEEQGQNWPQLAVELGYFDQSHFIKEFKTAVGRTPSEYARRLMQPPLT